MFQKILPLIKKHLPARLLRWFELPPFVSEEQAYLAMLTNGTLLTVAAIWLMVMVLQILMGKVLLWSNVVVALLAIGGLLVMREFLRRGQVYGVAKALPVLGFISTMVMVWNRGTTNSLHIVGFLLVISIATLLISARAGLIYAALSILFASGMAWLESGWQARSLLYWNLDPANQAFLFAFMVIFTFEIVYALKNVIDNTLEKSRHEIKQRIEAEDALRKLNASLDQRVVERTRELESVIEKQRQTEQVLLARNESFSILHGSTLDFLRYRDINELLQSLVDHAVEMLDSPFAEIVTLEGDELVVQAFSANQPYLEGDRSPRGTALLTWQAVDTREPAVVTDYSTWPQRRSLFEESNLRAAAELPILVGDGQTVLGVLGLARTVADYPYSPDEIEMGRLFTQIAALAIENIQLQSSQLELSLRDPLTGLHNRRYLFETLQMELARANRGEYTISFVLLDIDNFKALNDQHGHGAGDAILRALAELMKHMVRAGDILCRYGGDEHVIVMANTTSEVAIERTEQLRLAVERMVVDYEDKCLSSSISVGIATYPEHGKSADEVISHADQALYRSKNLGRNRVTLYQQ